MHKKFFRLAGIILFLVIAFGGVSDLITHSQPILRGYVQKVPENFYGTWRVKAKRVETDSPESFKEKTIDLWNISQVDNVIKLSNPFSGAEAEIRVDKVNGDTIEFSKTGKYNNKNLTDNVKISIQGDTFSGIDTLRLDTVSDVDNSIRKSVMAKYIIKGERLSGQWVK